MDAPYPALGPAVARLRRSADRHAHGMAVLAAIRALQARELAREVPDAPIYCASGTRHQDGDDIIAAIRAQHAAALSRARCRERDDAGWRTAYAEAMMAKRAAARKHPECQVRATDCVAPSPDPARKPAGQLARKIARPAAPPRPATLPPAVTVARTWMTGDVGVFLTFA